MNSSDRRRALPFAWVIVWGLVVLLIPSLALAQVTIPARIQAEDYDDQSGTNTTTTGDVDGDDDLYLLYIGDWASYDITVPSTGDYDITARANASWSGGGNYFRIEIDDVDVTGTFGPTSGNAYEDCVVEDVELTAGSHELKYYQVNDWSWDARVNWIEITSASAPTVSFTAASQSPSEGAGTATVTAELSATTGSTVTVPFTLGGTATETTDYTISSSPITITAGQTTGTATITIVNDSLDESDETVVVTMGTPTNATQGATTVHTATITDNDATPTVAFTAASQSEDEDAGTATVTAQLSAASGLPVTVPFTLGGTATETTDYTISSSPITITAGQTTGTATITIVNDSLDESDETVVVTMGTPTNATQGATTVHTATITDNDATPTVAFTAASQSEDEDAGTATVTAQLSAASGLTVTVPFTLGGTATETTDYTISSSPITITAGQTTGTATITIANDSLDENDETVIVTMGTPTNATQGATTAHTLTIMDDDSSGGTTLPAQIEAEDYDAYGGDFYLFIQDTTDTSGVSDLAGLGVGGTTSVSYNVTVATAGNYTFSVRIHTDIDLVRNFHIEIDNTDVTGTMSTSLGNVWETLVSDSVSLTSGNHVMKLAIETPNADWDWNTRLNYIDVASSGSGAPTVAFTSASQSQGEGAGTATVTAQLSATSESTVTVPFTLGGTATETTDYTISSSPITITAGQTTGTATITIANDSLDENDETVVVTMGTPTNATQGATTVHTATITDNDATPTVAFTAASQSEDEDAGTATVTAQLSAASGLPVTVPFTLGGTATETTDYTISSSPITITAGQTTGTATITIANDSLDENDETVIVTMGTPTNATQGGTTVHTLTITDDDTSFTMTIQAEDYDSQSGTSTTTTDDVDGDDDLYLLYIGDWASYDITVPSTGDYDITVRANASWSGGGNYFRIEIDDVDVTGTFGPTSGNAYEDCVVEDVELTAGSHELKYYQVNDWSWNARVNWISLTSEGGGGGTPTVAFTSASQSQGEGTGTATVTAQLSATSESAVTVPFTLGGTATETTDYTITSSPITITAGQTTGTATITIVDDTSTESSETVIVTMGTPTNATQGATTVHTLTITDNDATPTVAFTAASQSEDEDAGTATVTAQLSAASGLTVTVPYTLGGTATETTDYTISSSPITITAGQTTGTATITIVNDTLSESSETVIVTMGTPTNATQGATTVHTLTITDNDSGGNTAPTVDAGPDTGVNLSSSVTFNATVTDDDLPDPPGECTYLWTKYDGPGTVTFGTATAEDTTAAFSAVGTYTLRLTADDSVLDAYDDVTVVVVADSVFVLPCKIEAEDYRDGGEGVGYHDVSYAPHISACTDTGGGYALDGFELTEWTAYDIYVPQDAWFKFTLRACGNVDSQKGRIYIDDEDTVGLFSFIATYTETEAYTNVVIDGVHLSAGNHVMKFSPESANWTFKVNYIDIETTQDGPTVDVGPDYEITLPGGTVSINATVTDNGLPNPPGAYTLRWILASGPDDGFASFDNRYIEDPTVTFDYPGTYVLRLTADDSIAQSYDTCTITVNQATDRVTLPGRLEAEDYSDQGEGVSYHDTTSGNAGNVYRSDDVDIESCGDTGGGYDVSWIVADEWLAFAVAVSADTACYDVVARVSSTTSSRQIHVEVDGVDVTGPMTFDSTGGWTDVTAEGVHLTMGRHTIKVVMDTGDFKLNYVDILAETYEEYIVENNTANADIVISSSPVRTVTLAAEELQEIFEDITGATLPIVTTPTGADVHIYVGQSSYTDSLGISTAGLKYDAFKMVSGSDWLALIGADSDYEPIEPTTESTEDLAAWDTITGSTYRVPMIENSRNYNWSMDLWHADGCGSLQAVYEFLGDLGCRWYYPGTIGECLPDLDNIGLPTVNRTVEPDYRLRGGFMYGQQFLHADEDEIKWQLRMRYNMGNDSLGWTRGHGIGWVIGREEMKTAHPEYYSLIDGERQTVGWKGEGWPCMSSSGLIAANVDFLQNVFDHYDEPMFSAMPTDGYEMCQCELCEGKDTPERGILGRFSDYFTAYSNEVASELYLTHPSKKITIENYATAYLPPLDIEEFSPNVELNISRFTTELDESDAAYLAYIDLLDDWLELIPSKQVSLWDYYLDAMPYQQAGNPEYFTRMLKKEFRRYEDDAVVDCLGTFIEIGRLEPSLELDWSAMATNHLNMYVTQRLLWDSKLDLPALLDEYYDKFYGPAADEMKAFVEYAEANYHDFYDDSTILTTERTLLNAAIAAADGTGIYEDRVDLVDKYLQVAEE